MINWMRNAFLKLSPTYQLRTQVEQWYDADGTEDPAPTTARESAPCYAPDPTPEPQPYSAPDTYSPPSSCDSGGGSNNDY